MERKLTIENSFDYADPNKVRAPELGELDGSALSPYHCPVCGKLKLTRSGKRHKCGPTDKVMLGIMREEIAIQDAQIISLTTENEKLRAACIHARDFVQDVGTSDPDDVETMAAIERLSGELTAALDGPNDRTETPKDE